MTYEKQDSKIQVHAFKKNIKLCKASLDESGLMVQDVNNHAMSSMNVVAGNDMETHHKKHKSNNTNVLTSKGTLITFNGRETGVQSTFNMQWREIMCRFIQMVEHLMQTLIYCVSIEVMVDDLGNMWLIDALNYSYEDKPNNAEEIKKIKKRLVSKDRKCMCKTYCNYVMDIKNTIDDDDDLLQFNRQRDVFLGWINIAEETTDKLQVLPLKSILLEKHERFNYLVHTGKIKQE